MASLQSKIRKKLDLCGSAQFQGWKFTEKCINYNIVGNTDAGHVFVVRHANATHAVYMNLPALAAAKNKWFMFINANAGPMTISVIDSSTAASIVAYNNSAANVVNYISVGHNVGGTCQMWCDGTNYYHIDLGPTPALEVNTAHTTYTVHS